MIQERLVPVLVSVLIVVLVAVVQKRSRYLAAIVATMWIVLSASRGDQRQTADFVGSMVVGAVASLAFILACWFGLRQAWGLPVTLIFGAGIWLLVVWLPRWVGHSPS